MERGRRNNGLTSDAQDQNFLAHLERGLGRQAVPFGKFDLRHTMTFGQHRQSITLLGTSIKPDFSGVISQSGLPGDSQAIFESLMVRFGLFCLPIPPNRPHFGRSGGFRALERYHSHSVEIG